MNPEGRPRRLDGIDSRAPGRKALRYRDPVAGNLYFGAGVCDFSDAMSARRPPPLTESLILAGVSAFAAWTIYCNIWVYLGFTFGSLVGWSALPVVAAAAAFAACVFRLPGPDHGPAPAAKSRHEAPVWPLAFAGPPAAVAVLVQYLGGPYWLVWLLLICAAGAVLVTSRRAASAVQSFDWPGDRLKGWLVLGLAVAAAVATMVFHRPDLDDSAYLNFVVMALDNPDIPLLSRSGMWADPSIPLLNPVYRAHGFELLTACLSALTGLAHKTVYYLVLPPIFAVAAIAIHWRLAVHLVPRQALLVLICWLVLAVAFGEDHRSYGNFGFVRMFQGKGILVTVALPLCLLSALRFGETPGLRTGLVLALSAIAAIGSTSSGLATAPAIIGMALAGCLFVSGHRVRILVGGAAALAYPLMIGSLVAYEISLDPRISFPAPIPGAAAGLALVLGNGLIGAVALGLFPLAPLFVGNPARRRRYLFLTLAFVLALLNPWTAGWIAALVAKNLHWRIFWAVPFMMSAAIAIVAIAGLMARGLPRPARMLAPLAAMAFMLVASAQWSISPRNHVTIAWPREKVNQPEHRVAAFVVKHAPEAALVYVPEKIAAWITTFRKHPYPLYNRRAYLMNSRVAKRLGKDEVRRRDRLGAILEDRETGFPALEFMRQQLARERPAIVAFRSTATNAQALQALLAQHGYSGTQVQTYWVWRRQ